MAVFGMSSGWTGIWWNAFTRSMREKMVEKASCEVNSWMLGTGYLFSLVRALRAR